MTQNSPASFNGAQSFTAEGRSAATLRGVSETFSPGMTNGIPTQRRARPAPFHPISRSSYRLPNLPGQPGLCDLSLGWLATPPYIVDYSGLKVKATFFVATLTAPSGGITATPAWKQG